MKIFVTGITGFAGSCIANHFASLGHTVSGIGRKKCLPVHVTNCSYKSADICKPVTDADADIIIHAAALASETASYKEAFKVNVEGTLNVLNAAKNAKHFIYISSSSVYNFNSTPAASESQAGLEFERLSSYGKTKWLAEEVINRHETDFKKTILRPRAIYGKYDQVLLPRLLKLVKGKRLILPAHLSEKISLTNINNLILAIELCINKQQNDSAIFNVADDEAYDLYKVLTKFLSAVTAKKLRPLIVPVSVFELFISINEKLKLSKSFNRFAASSLTSNAVLNIDKIKSFMDYSPQKNFYNSCNEITSWIHHEQGWKSFFTKQPLQKIYT